MGGTIGTRTAIVVTPGVVAAREAAVSPADRVDPARRSMMSLLRGFTLLLASRVRRRYRCVVRPAGPIHEGLVAIKLDRPAAYFLAIKLRDRNCEGRRCGVRKHWRWGSTEARRYRSRSPLRSAARALPDLVGMEVRLVADPLVIRPVPRREGSHGGCGASRRSDRALIPVSARRVSDALDGASDALGGGWFGVATGATGHCEQYDLCQSPLRRHGGAVPPPAAARVPAGVPLVRPIQTTNSITSRRDLARARGDGCLRRTYGASCQASFA